MFYDNNGDYTNNVKEINGYAIQTKTLLYYYSQTNKPPVINNNKTKKFITVEDFCSILHEIQGARDDEDDEYDESNKPQPPSISTKIGIFILIIIFSMLMIWGFYNLIIFLSYSPNNNKTEDPSSQQSNNFIQISDHKSHNLTSLPMNNVENSPNVTSTSNANIYIIIGILGVILLSIYPIYKIINICKTRKSQPNYGIYSCVTLLVIGVLCYINFPVFNK